MRRARCLVTLALLVASSSAVAVNDPADVIVYADHIPALTAGGAPFQNPFEDVSGTPATRIVLERAPGIRHSLGGYTWGHVSWGKYVIFANHPSTIPPFGGHCVEDQRVGVLDTETKQFCELDLNPNDQPNAGVVWLAVANPTARQTRIYFSGWSTATPHCSVSTTIACSVDSNCPAGETCVSRAGFAFGYIEANLDQNPCTTPWNVVGFTGTDLNNAMAAELDSDHKPCGASSCVTDGMALIDPETVVLNNWFRTRIFIARVGPAGGVQALSVPDVYVMPPVWQPLGPGKACWQLRPVGKIMVDRTRADPADPCFLPTARRFTSSMETQCFDISTTPQNPSGCTCNPTPSPACTGFCDCDQTKCDASPGFPAQEFSFSFNNLKITPVSPLWRDATQGIGLAPSGAYDSYGHLWIGINPVIYFRNGSCEHSYFGSSTDVVPPDQTIGIDDFNQYDSGSWVSHVTQVGSTMHMLSPRSIQRATYGAFGWARDLSYRLGLGAPPPSCAEPPCRGVLPSESSTCCSGYPQLQCSPPCPGGCDSTCQTFEIREVGKRIFSTAGSPPSLWVEPGFFSNDLPPPEKNAYMLRVPLATFIPDGGSNVRPSIAWGGDRLWLVAEHGGALKYRIRDDGLWSEAWYDLGTNNITPVGGGTVIADATRVIVFARDSAGVVYAKGLTSSITCAPGSCTWDNWTPLPTSVTTNVEPAATFAGGNWYVAVRNMNDNRVYATNVFGLGYRPWFPVGTQTTDAAPSLAYHAPDARVWVAVREAGSPPVIKYTRIQGTTSEPWAVAGASGAQTWGTAPAIVSDGTRIRLFAAKANPLPNWTYQAIHDGTGWSNWRALPSGGGANWQMGAANVNGEVNVATQWWPAGIQERAVE